MRKKGDGLFNTILFETGELVRLLEGKRRPRYGGDREAILERAYEKGNYEVDESGKLLRVYKKDHGNHEVGYVTREGKLEYHREERDSGAEGIAKKYHIKIIETPVVKEAKNPVVKEHAGVVKGEIPSTEYVVILIGALVVYFLAGFLHL